MSREGKPAYYAVSRRTRDTLLISVVALLMAAAVLDRAFYRGGHSAALVGTQAGQVDDFERYHGRNFRVIKVVDGDTMDINIPDGKYPNTRVRLWGVDTPETEKSPGGEMYFANQASQFTKELTLGKTVTVFLDQDNNTRDKYGRLLAYVQLPDGQYLNELLLTEGCAYADLRFEHSFYNRYQQLEAAARSMDKGLWQQVSRDQLPGWLQREKPHLLATD